MKKINYVVYIESHQDRAHNKGSLWIPSSLPQLRYYPNIKIEKIAFAVPQPKYRKLAICDQLAIDYMRNEFKPDDPRPIKGYSNIRHCRGKNIEDVNLKDFEKQYLIANGQTSYEIKLDEKRSELFHLNGNKRIEVEEGFVLINADIKLNDKSLYQGIASIDENSSGELWGIMIFLPDKIIDQKDKDFCSQLGKSKDEVFPYKYKLRAPLECEDIHVDKNGWSIP